MPEKPRILVARTDRIGDVVLSLPVFTSIRAAYPGAHICALTRDYTRGLLENRPDIDEVISFDSPNNHIPNREFFRLAADLRRKKFDAAIALFSNFSVAALLAASGIPVRIGPASKLAQFFLTHRLAQRRSKSARHEADHNLDLLKPTGIHPVREASIKIPKAARHPFRKTHGKPLIGIHPGNGGSARNWPEKNYSRLISELSAQEADVAVTGSPAENAMVERIVKEAGAAVQTYIGEGDLMELAAALSQLDVLIAPSTGPLHIASATGTPVVGIYCPIRVCLPQRWGPIGADDTALVPDVPPCERCEGEKCSEWDCMEKITVGRVKEAALARTGAPVKNPA